MVDFDNNNFQEARVFIAGASQGIGEEIAIQFANRNAAVTISGRNGLKLRQASDRIMKITSKNIKFVEGDFANGDLDELLGFVGDIDILIINYGDTNSSVGIDIEDQIFNDLIKANLTGPINLAKRVAKRMKVKKKGVILFIGSVCSSEDFGAPIGYSVGKAGLKVAMKIMSRELGEHNIRVNMISPGHVRFNGGRWDKKMIEDPLSVTTKIKNEVPLGRFGDVRDIALASIFLCSTNADYITGADLIVDGGLTRFM